MNCRGYAIWTVVTDLLACCFEMPVLFPGLYTNPKICFVFISLTFICSKSPSLGVEFPLLGLPLAHGNSGFFFLFPFLVGEKLLNESDME